MTTQSDRGEAIAYLLDNLHEAIQRRDALVHDREAKHLATIPAEVKTELDAIEAEYAPLITAAREATENATLKIKTMVLLHEASVKGSALQAIYVSGRRTWDNKMLEGLMLAFPQLKDAQKIGDPTVTIREIQSK